MISGKTRWHHRSYQVPTDADPAAYEQQAVTDYYTDASANGHILDSRRLCIWDETTIPFDGWQEQVTIHIQAPIKEDR